MDNQTITKVSLDFLKQNVKASYMDGDGIVLTDVKELPKLGSLQMDMIIALVCTDGKLQIDINGKTFTVQPNDMLVCPPNVFLDDYMISPKFNAKLLGLSYSALQRKLNMNKNIWDMIMLLTKSPVYHLNQESIELMNKYNSFLSFKTNNKDGIFHKEVMSALFQAAFYDICSILSPLIEEEETKNVHMTQGYLLLKRFLKLLADSQGKERSVTAFAQQLCITPKYLTTVCKASSGKTALEWIHEYTTEVIVQQLKYSDKSVKEISDGLGFPNISFFGKFVKGRIGVSPNEYRRQLSIKED